MNDIFLDLDFPDCWVEAWPEASVIELAAFNHACNEHDDFAADRKDFADGE